MVFNGPFGLNFPKKTLIKADECTINEIYLLSLPRRNCMSMLKNLNKMILICALLIGTGAASYAFMPGDGIEADVANGVSINVMQTSVRITGAQGQFLEIYKITGLQVEKIKIDSNDKKIELNLAKGCYILKVGKLVRKVSIK